MYSEDFEPVAKIGENISVVTAQGVEKFYEVVYVEPLPASVDLEKNFGSIAAGSSVNGTKVTLMEMEGSARTETDISEIGQFRFYPLDDIAITVKLPAAQSRFKTRNSEIRVDYNTQENDPSLKSTEIYIFEDDTAYMDIDNVTNYTIPQSRVIFFGWRIVGKQLASEPDKYTRVVATGFAR